MTRANPDLHPIRVRFPAGLEGIDTLVDLALDLRWTWNHGAHAMWRELDPRQWDLTQTPWGVMQTVSVERVQRMLGDPAFRQKLDACVQARDLSEGRPAWFQQQHPDPALSCAAYFSMEFMLNEILPIYSGGLGNVAGDQLKAASNLGVPVVGIGLLYQRGYFRQFIDGDGAQQCMFPYNEPGQMPMVGACRPDGEQVRIEVPLPAGPLWLRAWKVRVGRGRLYLLDSNDPENSPADRAITGELYGGGPELRLKQEIALGIGGWRLLAALGIKPEVCHLNEGHAAFAVLERARSFMADAGVPFEVALTVTRAGNLFTTHTAVDAGFDRFPRGMLEQHLGAYATRELGISFDEFFALGCGGPSESADSFNMAYLAMRGGGAVNAVSRLHGQVSRALFQPLFPRWPREEVPVGHITNGVHTPSWDSAEADALWTEACGKNRWLGDLETLERDVRRLSDAKLWELRIASRKSFVAYAQDRVASQMAAAGADPVEIDLARQRLRPEVLTLGFARRFVGYKRPNLLLHDPERLVRILTHPQRPVQLILAGKAHPADLTGQALIREWTHFIRHHPAHPPVVFLADYDMLVAERLVRGVDVWVNTPRRPWEASGTSGMKVLVNGGLNISELDGWWAEGYSPEVGWSLGDRRDHGDDPAWDAAEADELYGRIEREIAPEFYGRDDRGISPGWVARMRESMARLTPLFSANRAVREYTQQRYLPAAEAYRRRAEDKGRIGRRLTEERHAWAAHWEALRFGELRVRAEGDQQLIEVEVHLGGLDTSTLSVELYADGVNGEAPVRLKMNPAGPVAEGSSCSLYRASVPATRPTADYTPRIVPHGETLAVPLEASHILWWR